MPRCCKVLFDLVFQFVAFVVRADGNLHKTILLKAGCSEARIDKESRRRGPLAPHRRHGSTWMQHFDVAAAPTLQSILRKEGR
jgi:hypothetical protein